MGTNHRLSRRAFLGQSSAGLLKHLCLVVAALGLAGNIAAADSADELAPLRIVLVGDSTVASYPEPPADRPSLTGWGQVFDEFFSDRVTVLNHAVSGRSSKSFLGEGLWSKALEAKPDYVFIQFGHNDQPGKGERSTDANTDYQDYLRRYITDARASGRRRCWSRPWRGAHFRMGNRRRHCSRTSTR